MTTVAAIAAKALNAVSAAITDAVHVATLTRTAQGAYNPATGAYGTTESAQTGRAVFASETPAEDIFPGYVLGPQDQMLLLEGFTSCAENDVVTIGGVDRTVTRCQDIAGAGTLFYVVAT